LVWLAPATLWMYDLTPPGYAIANLGWATALGLGAMAVPPGRGRWLALPGVVVLFEGLRWWVPFGGVPLATIAQGQADGPFVQVARVGGALAVVGVVAIGGIALSAAWVHRWRPAALAAGVVAIATLVGFVAPRGEATGELDVALVQGGGPQRTRTIAGESELVFERHLEASSEVLGPVDLVVWPENTVAVDGPLTDSTKDVSLAELARTLDATLVVGATERGDTSFRNASIVYEPDGTIGDRYDKVRRVPFGEWVPLRSLVEPFAGGTGLASRDAVVGEEPAVVDTPAGRLGVSISWEVFFGDRAADAIGNGGEVLLNPTNGASYWLTQVQTQQVASSQLRAVETGRWVLQVAPTGMSAVVTPSGEVLERTDVSERRVLQHTVERRDGQTVATFVGPWPVLLTAAAAVVLGWRRARGLPGDSAPLAR
jgi:apolipoprotein N-acyltransferase